MKRFTGTILISFFTILFLNIGSLSTAKAASASTIINLTNHARATQNLIELKQNQQLTSAAEAKAEDMLAHDYFAHNSPTGKTPWDFIKAAGYNYVYAGENLAIGYTDDQELHEAWMDSPTHRANILNENFIEIGLAVMTGEYEGARTTVVVQMFGAPLIQNSTIASVESDNRSQVEPGQINGAQIKNENASAPSEEILVEEDNPPTSQIKELFLNQSRIFILGGGLIIFLGLVSFYIYLNFFQNRLSKT